MMQLSTMQAIVETLQDNGTCLIGDQIGARWNADAGSVRYFRASANFVFKFTVSGEAYVLRFNHEAERTAEGVQSEVAFVNALTEQGVLVAKPVPSVQGNFVESLQTNLGIYHAVVFEALPGVMYDTDELTPELFAAWGKALGSLHNASTKYKEAGRPTWRKHLEGASALIPATETAAHALLSKLEGQLAEMPTTATNYGLIHFDFETDNLIWTDHGLGVIDFDESAFYWLIADIAFALRDVFEDDADKVDINHPSLRLFVNGYREVRELPEENVALLPLFLGLHNLLTFAKLYRSVGAAIPQDAPVWLHRLRLKLVTTLDAYRARFPGAES